MSSGHFPGSNPAASTLHVQGFRDSETLIFSKNLAFLKLFSNFLRLSALKNEPTAQLRQYIQDDRLDSLKVYYIILTIILYSNN